MSRSNNWQLKTRVIEARYRNDGYGGVGRIKLFRHVWPRRPNFGERLMTGSARDVDVPVAIPPPRPDRSGFPAARRVDWDHPSEQDRRRSEAEQTRTDIAAGR